MTTDDKVILEYARLRAATPEEVCNYCEGRFAELVEKIRAKPVPPQPTGQMLDDAAAAQAFATAYASWHNRFLIHHGRCLESLVAAQAWGHISAEQFQALKRKLEAALNWKLASAIMGGIG